MNTHRFKIVTGVLGLWASMLAGCGASGNRTNVELIQDMMESPALKAQDHLESDREAPAMRLPPEGTVARNQSPYKFGQDAFAAEKNLKNPVAGNMSPKVLEQGRKYYSINCQVCHGATGLGDGPIAPKMAMKPPSLVSEKVRAFNDGRIFHIITAGQGVMGSYATQIQSQSDRWAIVNYVRSPQQMDTKGGK